MYQKRKHDKGFTLTEVLIVVAITIILLAVSFVAAAYYRKHLKITELDNAAREIFMLCLPRTGQSF